MSANDSNEFQVEEQTELVYSTDTIWTAVFNADKVAIDRLIESDCNMVEIRGAVGECPIHMLFLYGTDAHMEIARDLITKFPIIVTQVYNRSVYFGENILHIAIVKRNVAMVEWLLSNDFLQPYKQNMLNATATGEFFALGKPSYYGETPLGFACCTNQWDIVEILLKYGASMDMTDSNGNTILHMLVICNLPEIYTKFKARWIMHNSKVPDILQLWDRQNHDGLTPLTLAADLGRTKMLAWLLHERRTIQWSYGNVSCVLNPLDQIDVDLEDNTKTSKLSVIEVIVKNNNSDLIHPIIISLIDKKWKYFVYRILIRRFFITFLYLLIFLMTTILEQTQFDNVDEEIREHTQQINKTPRHIRSLLCTIGHGTVLAGALWKFTKEIQEISHLGLQNYFHTTGSIFLENLLACSFCICIFIAQILRLYKMEYSTVVLAIAALLGWGYMFFFLMPFRFTGPFVIMIYKMLFNDVLRFCIIYVIFLLGFSQSFFILFNENGLQGYMSSMKHCFLGLLGDFDLEYYIGGRHPLASVTTLIIYIVVITILLLNLLIAMMGDTYADVKRSAKKLWHLERARIALDVENGMTAAQRKSKPNKYWVDIQGKRYLQVEQVNNDSFDYKIDQESSSDED